LMA
jgi:hypothetical protein